LIWFEFSRRILDIDWAQQKYAHGTAASIVRDEAPPD